jgi:DNA-binding response OmpR family regulator
MIPVIIVSGEAGGQTKEHCKQLGAAGYFEKPIDFEALRMFLRKTAKSRSDIPRSEVRVRLRVPLKLRGTDAHGKKFEEAATTENVSLSGFLCACTVELATDSTVEVCLMSSSEEYVGKAKVVHADSKGAPLRRYGCRFVEKTGPWVLK